jgi:hypothetical protein
MCGTMVPVCGNAVPVCGIIGSGDCENGSVCKISVPVSCRSFVWSCGTMVQECSIEILVFPSLVNWY